MQGFSTLPDGEFSVAFFSFLNFKKTVRGISMHSVFFEGMRNGLILKEGCLRY